MTRGDAGRLGGEVRTFARFCITGGVGFVTDAVILACLTRGFDAGPFLARSISFPAAVMITFLLHRSWSFRDSARQPILRAFSTYFAVQSLGLFCNVLVYAGAVLLLPSGLNEPLVCLALASAVALAVNYTGLRQFVFSNVR